MVKVHISRWPGIQWLYHVFQACFLKVFRMPRDKIRPHSCCRLNRMPRDETALELSRLIVRMPRDETVIMVANRIARMPRDETILHCHEPPDVSIGCKWSLFRKIKIPGTIMALIRGQTRFRWRTTMELKPAFQSGNGRVILNLDRFAKQNCFAEQGRSIDSVILSKLSFRRLADRKPDQPKYTCFS